MPSKNGKNGDKNGKNGDSNVRKRRDAPQPKKKAAEKESITHHEEELKSDLRGDYGSVGILLVLYVLQGLPMGLSAVLPMIMKERGVSFADVGTFSLNTWPFSLKLLWAPLVDTWYIASVGRRKTWLIPSQLLIGFLMLGMSTCVDGMLYVEKPAIYSLTGLFFLLYFLCATQDIAVDGWALTMLRQENVGWAATTNAFGQTLGYAIGFNGYMMLDEHLTLASFMLIVGVIFIVVTVLVALLKKEVPIPPEEEPEDLATSYRQMMSILKLKPIRHMILVLATWKMAFPITDAIGPLKFQEYGVPKEQLASVAMLLMPLMIALPILASKWTSGKTPLDIAMWVYPLRVAAVPATAILAYCTPASMSPTPYVFYSGMFLLAAIGGATTELIFVSQMAFFARVSDPALGGTYMTLLNTLGNLGGKWPPTVAFYMVDALSCKQADCAVQRDGFYVVAGICTILGIVWYVVGAPVVYRMQRWKLEDWKVR